MPIENIPQPELLPVSATLRLRRFADLSADVQPLALGWYQDPETMLLVDGPEAKPYTPQGMADMYKYLEEHGELYWIEENREGSFVPIGDVSLLPNGDTPIVVGDKNCRGRGVGRAVLGALLTRAKTLGLTRMQVEIYDYNEASRRLFESFGYRQGESTQAGHYYWRTL